MCFFIYRIFLISKYIFGGILLNFLWAFVR